ncbi:hypothetical protein QVD17_19556 [Tagetes erecta]|uniref:Reverse transcriptase domain-containing protein n=1 Tax=Tagetes erecta TaxID=13708 RepID=A0AAD8KJN9_TARER|nr:hypothetical protein QVD17_19556 [Tagetes erecta]
MVVDDEVAPEPNRVRESVVDSPGVERGFPSIFKIDVSSSTPRLDSMLEKSIERFLLTLTASLNALVVFMDLMKRVYRPYLDKFVIVFIDDILINSQSKGDHEHILKLILEMLRNEKFYAMISKCESWLREVYCLGHVINEKGPLRVEALYERKCCSRLCCAKMGEKELCAPEIIQETADKVFQVTKIFEAIVYRQKCYGDNRMRTLEIRVGNHVFLKVSPWKGVVRFGN